MCVCRGGYGGGGGWSEKSRKIWEAGGKFCLSKSTESDLGGDGGQKRHFYESSISCTGQRQNGQTGSSKAHFSDSG